MAILTTRKGPKARILGEFTRHRSLSGIVGKGSQMSIPKASSRVGILMYQIDERKNASTKCRSRQVTRLDARPGLQLKLNRAPIISFWETAKYQT
jgi:hypothetical protein